MAILGLDRRDGRNLIVVMLIVTVVMAVLAEGSAGIRLLAGVLAGLISAGFFVVSTLLINRYKPDHW